MLLGAKGIATRSKDATTVGAPSLTTGALLGRGQRAGSAVPVSSCFCWERRSVSFRQRQEDRGRLLLPVFLGATGLCLGG